MSPAELSLCLFDEWAKGIDLNVVAEVRFCCGDNDNDGDVVDDTKFLLPKTVWKKKTSIKYKKFLSIFEN